MKLKKELNQIKAIGEQTGRRGLIYETNKYVFTLQQFETIRSFGDSISNSKITIGEADKNIAIF